MASFKLQIAFSDQDLKRIKASGTKVVIAKPSLNGGLPNVIWQVFKPFQTNTFSWKDEYGMYASVSEIKNGAQLRQLANVPIGVSKNKLYVLEDNATISGPVSGGELYSFALANKYTGGIVSGTNDPKKRMLALGLFQDANINGTDIKGNAVAAVPVLFGSTAIMRPPTTIYIWLQSQVKSNSVITKITSPITTLFFGSGIKDISVKYDSLSGQFLSE